MLGDLIFREENLRTRESGYYRLRKPRGLADPVQYLRIYVSTLFTGYGTGTRVLKLCIRIPRSDRFGGTLLTGPVDPGYTAGVWPRTLDPPAAALCTRLPHEHSQNYLCGNCASALESISQNSLDPHYQQCVRLVTEHVVYS